MKLQIGKYKLEHDGMCVVLSFKIDAVKPDAKRKTRTVIVGYYPNFTTAIDRLIEMGIADSDTTSLCELTNYLSQLRDDIFHAIGKTKGD